MLARRADHTPDNASSTPTTSRTTRLLDLRNQWGLTQQEAADLVGLKRSMFAAIETGFRAADQGQRARIADLYGIDDEDFDTLWQRTRDTRIARLKPR